MYDGSVRLRGGPSKSAGRLEVLHEGQWGTVCFNEFDFAEAKVVCAQLGLNGVSHFGVQTDDNAPYGWAEPTAPVWMDALRCTGDEAQLVDCDFGGLGQFWGQRNTGICRGHPSKSDLNNPNKWRFRTDVFVECTGQTPSPPPSPPSPERPPPALSPPPPSYESVAKFCHPGCPQSLAVVTTLSHAWRNTIVRAPQLPASTNPEAEGYHCDLIDGVNGENPMGGDSLAEASWYQFTGDAGVRMPSQAPGTKRCGTEYPG